MMMRRVLQLHSSRSVATATSGSSSRRLSFLASHHPKHLLNPLLPPPFSSLSRLVKPPTPTPTPTIYSSWGRGRGRGRGSGSGSATPTLRFLNTESSEDIEDDDDTQDDPFRGEDIEEKGNSGGSEEGDATEGWEEEEDLAQPEVGDGGDGGGVVLHGVPWGVRALSIAHEVLTQFGDNMKLFSFKTTAREYVYVRLDKLSNEYGCPTMEELELYSQEYKKRLDEVGEHGEIPENLALEVSSPGAERLLKIPDDLDRFANMPMRVCYVEDVDSKCREKDGVFNLESIETESESCVWKLANVKENRDPNSKGRPLTRKQRDWRLKLPYSGHKRVLLYVEY